MVMNMMRAMPALRFAPLAICFLTAQPAQAAFPADVEGWTIARTASRECIATGTNIEIRVTPFITTRFRVGVEAREPEQVLGGRKEIAYSIGVGPAEYAGFTLKPTPFHGVGHWQGFTSNVSLLLEGQVAGTSIVQDLHARPTLMAAPTGQSKATVSRPVPPAVMDAVSQCIADITPPNEPVRRVDETVQISIVDRAGALPAGARLAASSYTLNVSERGAVTGCIVQRSTGYALADSLTCDELRRDAVRFHPATNAQGRPVASTYLMEVPAITMP